jgi:LPXTG-motif cell wall-anchored protein
MSKKNTLYFIGQIKCPEDDNCEYNQNSLYIISDEDKVIEVEDKESTNIIIVIGTVLIVLVGLIYIKKKKGLE